VLDALSRGLTQKMLHGTFTELRQAEGSRREELAETVSRLFLRSNGRLGAASGTGRLPQGHGKGVPATGEHGRRATDGEL
jgi:hypothetical protein